MSRCSYRHSRPRTGPLELTYSPDPFRIMPDRSLTAGPPTYADLLREADRFRQQGIITAPPISMKQVSLGSASVTLPGPGWFPDHVQLDLAQDYPPGYVLYVVLLDWTGGNCNTNLRIVNSSDGAIELNPAYGHPSVYMIWI
jgi:hypothetical protein